MFVFRAFVFVISIAAGAATVGAQEPTTANSPWSGFYVGGHSGYGWSKNDFELQYDADKYGGISGEGQLFGLHAGYNWQKGSLVAGIEIDFAHTQLEGSRHYVVNGTPNEIRDDVQFLGSARARVGYAFSPTLMFYGTGGVAWERLDRLNLPSGLSNRTRSPDDFFGWVMGAGAEVRIANSSWVGRFEYLHYDFGTTEREFYFVDPGIFAARRANHQTLDVARVGLSYQFGAQPGPPNGACCSLDIWTGFYAGFHGGHGWGNHDFSERLGFVEYVNDNRSSGTIFGLHAGHLWNLGGVVGGFELDLSGSNVEGKTETIRMDFGGGDYRDTRIGEEVSYLGSLRARLGVSPLKGLLLYGTAGLAWERLERTQYMTDVFGGVATNFGSVQTVDRFGWVAGLGLEQKIAGTPWSGRVEYLHYDFGSVLQSELGPGVPDRTYNKHQVDVVRAGLTYSFAGSGGETRADSACCGPILWNGLYIGGHGGYGRGRNEFSQSYVTSGIDSEGALFGGHFGRSWQYGSIIGGVELDFSGGGIEGSVKRNSVLPFYSRRSDEIDGLATARARLGWALSSDGMIYATGGMAWERLKRTDENWVFPNGETSSFRTDRFGWVAGLGVEYMIGSNWSGRVEYLHYDFGTSFPIAEGGQTVDVVRMGLSYHLK